MKEVAKLALLVGLATTLVLPKRQTAQVLTAGGNAATGILGKLIPAA